LTETVNFFYIFFIGLTKETPFHNLNNQEKGIIIQNGGKGVDMTLYLIQHGEAKSEAEDPERSLTINGEQEVYRVAKAAKKLDICPSKIYHSGKRRAQQTAEIIADPLNVPIQAAQGLNPLDDIRPWVEQISKETDDLMIVGHLPFLEKLTSFLLCGDEKARLVSFRYGAIVCLEQKGDKNWAVRWILIPEMA
jgi:phosphohistidine phosphatase